MPVGNNHVPHTRPAPRPGIEPRTFRSAADALPPVLSRLAAAPAHLFYQRAPGLSTKVSGRLPYATYAASAETRIEPGPPGQTVESSGAWHRKQNAGFGNSEVDRCSSSTTLTKFEHDFAHLCMLCHVLVFICLQSLIRN